MDLKQIAEKPTLVKLTLDKEHIIKTYGEPVDFYMYDRQSIPTFMKMSALENDTGEMIEMVKELVMDKNGNRMLDPDEELPVPVMVDMIEKVVDQLGNSASQTMNE